MQPDRQLGWNDALQASWEEIGQPGAPGRVVRIDRGWSSVVARADDDVPMRVRNLFVDVAIGDWVVPSDDDERIDHIIPRTSAFVRRASFEGDRFESDTLAANIDVVFLVHAIGVPPNQRRLERELVLAFDSGAQPVVLLTKADLIDDPSSALGELGAVASGVPVVLASGRDGTGLVTIRNYAAGNRTLAFLGASGVGKSTLVNALLDHETMDTGAVREADHRGRHTTVAAQLLRLPGEGWLIDTPGVRAVSLWLSGRGIERAFADVFELMDSCRFRDCKHDREPGCAVRAAVDDGRLDPARLASMERLVAEESALEDEQRRQLKLDDRRWRPRPPHLSLAGDPTIAAVMHIRIVSPKDRTEKMLAVLESVPNIVNLVVLPGAARRPMGDVVLLDVPDESVNQVVGLLQARGIDRSGSISIQRGATVISAAAQAAADNAPGRSSEAVVWAEVTERARVDSELSVSFVLMLALSMLIAAVGILTDSVVLIIGAMVIGPEYGPLIGLAYAMYLRSPAGMLTAARTLAIGLTLAIVVTFVFALVVRLISATPEAYEAGVRPLTQFTSQPDWWSVVVAVLAALAGTLSLVQSRSSALVGVFISVTTIPAAANIGVAAANQRADEAWGAFVQLALNVALIVVVGAITFVAERAIWRRLSRRRPILP